MSEAQKVDFPAPAGPCGRAVSQQAVSVAGSGIVLLTMTRVPYLLMAAGAGAGACAGRRWDAAQRARRFWVGQKKHGPRAGGAAGRRGGEWLWRAC